MLVPLWPDRPLSNFKSEGASRAVPCAFRRGILALVGGSVSTVQIPRWCITQHVCVPAILYGSREAFWVSRAQRIRVASHCAVMGSYQCHVVFHNFGYDSWHLMFPEFQAPGKNKIAFEVAGPSHVYFCLYL